MGRPSKYTDEFKGDAVELMRFSGRSINDVARSCRSATRRCGTGCARTSLAAGGSGLSAADKDAEITRLRAEVVELRVEKEILRKAAPILPWRWVGDQPLPVHLHPPPGRIVDHARSSSHVIVRPRHSDDH